MNIILYPNSFLKYPGRGDEVRARIKKFNDESFVKGMATITFFILLGFYAKMTNVSDSRNNHFSSALAERYNL